MLIFILTNLTFYASPFCSAQTLSLNNISQQSESSSNVLNQEITPDGMVTIKGLVVDGKTYIPVPKARIEFQKMSSQQEKEIGYSVKQSGFGYIDNSYGRYHQKDRYEAVSNAEGRFELTIPIVMLGQENSYLFVNAPGFDYSRLNAPNIDLKKVTVVYLYHYDPRRYRDDLSSARGCNGGSTDYIDTDPWSFNPAQSGHLSIQLPYLPTHLTRFSDQQTKSSGLVKKILYPFSKLKKKVFKKDPE